MWKKLVGASVAIALFVGAWLAPAAAQTNPGLTQGQKLTPAQWNNLFASKQDTLGYVPLNTAGGVLSGRLVTAAPGASTAGLNLFPGSTPGSPANGDLWITSSGFFARVNGTTIGPIGGASSSSFAATAPVEVSFPAGVTTYACSTCVTLAGSQTLTNKTLTAPAINTATAIGGSYTALSTFGIRSSGSGAFDLRIANTENLTANQTLTVTLNDAARTLNLGGNLTTAGAFSMSGAFSFTGTLTNNTTVTFPLTGTLATLAGSETLTNKTLTASSNVLGGVTMTLGSDATGDIYYRNSGGQLTRLPVGSNSNVLTLSGGLPAWLPGSAAASVTVGTTTVSSCAASGLFLYNNGGTLGCSFNPLPFGFENCSLAASVGSNLLTVALKDAGGNDASATSPCNLYFRSATANNGSWTLVQLTAALSINTNATGATLGSSNNTAFRFWVVVFNNGGTPVLGLINCSTSTEIFPLDESSLSTSTPISGTATAAGTFYTPNGTTVTAKAFLILGYIEYNSTGLTTAGTYATAPNFVQTMGPGIKKPNDVVREKYVTSSTASTHTATTGGTSTTTNLTTSFVPTSAANLIEISASGGLDVSVSAAASCQLARNSNSNLFGGQARFFAASAGGAGQNMLGIDKPNTTSSTTYAPFCWISSGTATWGILGTPTSMIIKERMG